MAKYFLIAGETSGDKHAAALIQKIQQQDANASFSGLGGDQMTAAGCHLYQHCRQMAFMALAAVLRNIGQVQRNFHIAKEALLAENPDALILIDYPSFNLRMAAFCRKHLPHTKIYYYVPPKVWAWKRRRIHRIARLCDRVLGIFPFEPAFYARYGYACTYVGNPTVEEIEQYAQSPKTVNQSPKAIVLLPGSRESEVSHCLPTMLEAARRFPDYHIVVSAAPTLTDAYYMPYLRTDETLTRDTYSAVQQAEVAIVNSGTATLETALLGCPQVAVYHLAWSWLIALIRWAQPLVFRIKHFTLVNILADKEVISELVANDFTTDKVAAELQRLLSNQNYRNDMLAAYRTIRTMLGISSASLAAATIIVNETTNR